MFAPPPGIGFPLPPAKTGTAFTKNCWSLEDEDENEGEGEGEDEDEDEDEGVDADVEISWYRLFPKASRVVIVMLLETPAVAMLIPEIPLIVVFEAQITPGQR